MNNELSILWHYINYLTSVQAWMAFCCAFPAILLRMAQNRAKSRGFTRSGALGLPWVKRLEALNGLPISGLEKGQKYSLFMGQKHKAFILNTTFI